MSASDFKGYQETFHVFVSILKSAVLVVPPSGPINVDPDIPEGIHIWTEIKVFICNANQFMKPFLKLFGVEEVNGLSPFAVDIDILYDLIKLIEYLFLPPKRDLQGNPNTENSTKPYDNGDSEEYADYKHTCDIIPCFVKNIQSQDLDKYKYHESIDSTYVDDNHD